jgi:hypothetical protein
MKLKNALCMFPRFKTSTLPIESWWVSSPETTAVESAEIEGGQYLAAFGLRKGYLSKEEEHREDEGKEKDAQGRKTVAYCSSKSRSRHGGAHRNRLRGRVGPAEVRKSLNNEESERNWRKRTSLTTFSAPKPSKLESL